MALPYKHAGTFLRSPGLTGAIAHQTKLLNLKPAKRIVFTFDPFGENITSIRNVLFQMNIPAVQETNPKCIVKTNIVCNRANPTVDVTLQTGHKLLFNTQNLEALEILKLFNKLVSSQFKPEEVAAVVPQTKAQKKKK
ncbi:large ribosomal subunit protein mL53 [Palaemon carinicauda]|uniref:large ribosomal subunit protein mL53 n=1 Tax=Palaemon carinicauda TaxID=392227 RepID=UPI0035B5A30C